MDPIPLVIIIISITLTALLVVLGIQVYFILKEMRFGVRKVNKMLDDAGRVTGTVGDSVENMSTFITGLKAGIKTFTALKGKGHSDE